MQDYTHKQLVGLVNVLPLKRRLRQELMQLLQDLEKASSISSGISTSSNTITTTAK